jgi:hypothetical protein
MHKVNRHLKQTSKLLSFDYVLSDFQFLEPHSPFVIDSRATDYKRGQYIELRKPSNYTEHSPWEDNSTLS